jgi:hypothetical protein
MILTGIANLARTSNTTGIERLSVTLVRIEASLKDTQKWGRAQPKRMRAKWGVGFAIKTARLF